MDVNELLATLCKIRPLRADQIVAMTPVYRKALGHAEGPRLDEAFEACMAEWTDPYNAPQPAHLAKYLPGKPQPAGGAKRGKPERYNELMEAYLWHELRNSPLGQEAWADGWFMDLHAFARPIANAQAQLIAEAEANHAPIRRLRNPEDNTRWQIDNLLRDQRISVTFDEQDLAMWRRAAKRPQQPMTPTSAGRVAARALPMEPERRAELLGRPDDADAPKNQPQESAENGLGVGGDDGSELDDDPFADVPPVEGPDAYGAEARD